MFCGTRSFSKVDEDPAAPRQPTRSGCKRKKKVSRRSKNPYSGGGLDKFSKVMSELQAKREKIMAEAGGGSTSQGDVAMVLFMYNNSHDWIPIVVRLRENQPPSQKKSISKKPQPLPPLPSLPPLQSEQSNSEVEAHIPLAATTERKEEKIFSWQGKEGCIERWRPTYRCLVVIVVVLVCLVMFGRVFAVCCTSIWWYLVPILKGDEIVDVRRSMKKKDYMRRVSDKRLGGGIPVIATSSQPKRVSGFQESTSPRSHGIHGNEKKGDGERSCPIFSF